MTALQDVQAIWRVTVIQREPGMARTVRLLALLLALAAGVVIALEAARQGGNVAQLAARGLCAVAAVWVAIVWTLAFIPTSVLLNAASGAPLLPRQRRRLIQIGAGSWLLASAGAAVAFGEWEVWLQAGLYLLVLAWGAGGNRHAWYLIVLANGWGWLSNKVLPPAVVDALGSTGGTLALGVLLVATLAYVLHWLYPAREDTRGDGYGRRRAEMERITNVNWKSHADATRAGWRPVIGLYAAALRRDCRVADPGALLAHALGPAAHWSAWLFGIAIVLLAAVAGRVAITLAPAFAWAALFASMAPAGLAALLLVVAFDTFRIGQALNLTRGEQALLRLAPRTGDAVLLNRRLATRLLRLATFNWAALTAALLLGAVLLGAGPAAALRQFAFSCLGGLMALPGVLGDYARDSGVNLRRIPRAIVAAALVGALAVGFGWLTGSTPWPWMIALSAGIAAFRLRQDWRRMLAAPPAFPAARMDNVKGGMAS